MKFLLVFCSFVIAIQAVPLAKRMVDMTYTFDETVNHLSFIKDFQLNVLYNGTDSNGDWVQFEEYASHIHFGTHLDAPAHFSKGGKTVDQIPIERFSAPAAVIDFTARANLDHDAEATIEDFLRWEEVTGQSLNETIVLMRFGWSRKWKNSTAFLGLTPKQDESEPEPGYYESGNSSFKLVVPEIHFPGLGVTAAQWLVENRNIYGLGSEAVSFDKGPYFHVHNILLPHDIYGLENVANVDKIPIYGAKLHVLPMKIGKASGAPTRIIATYPDVIFDLPTST